jgi:hypothetical protein
MINMAKKAEKGKEFIIGPHEAFLCQVTRNYFGVQYLRP